MDQKPIKVHEKALAHLSRGLYRSPGSALRELVSNAWDANATTVRISTNPPNFFQISIEDNGDGFDKEEFDRVMAGGIGFSEKRITTAPAKSMAGRDRRLGIGLLGIAQIAPGFTVTSKTEKGPGFRARIRMYDLLKERIDKNDPELVKDDIAYKTVDVGTYEFDEEYDPGTRRHGTLIIADDVHPQFSLAFKESVKLPEYAAMPAKWLDAVKSLSKVDSLQLRGDYWRLLWELSAASPIPYISSDVVPDGRIKADQERLSGYRFRLIVDNVELFKPVWLKGDSYGYTTHLISAQTRKIYGKKVSFHGYLAVREGQQIKPDELRGIMLRIRNVGIGYYDQTLLDYRVNQGPRNRWVTGEIYIDEGLEDALNIDRDSFNRFHPEFRSVQEFFHEMLRTEVFPKVYKKMDARSSERKEKKAEQHKVHLGEVVSKASGVPVRIREQRPTQSRPSLPQAAVTDSERGIDLTVPPDDAMKTKKSYRELAAAILAIYEVSQREKTADQRRAMFAMLLSQLLKGW